jgi:hypothetical protein
MTQTTKASGSFISRSKTQILYEETTGKPLGTLGGLVILWGQPTLKRRIFPLPPAGKTTPFQRTLYPGRFMSYEKNTLKYSLYLYHVYSAFIY